MKRILILGGSRFIGRNLMQRESFVDSYDITLFNRGITNPNLFPRVNHIKGDRTKAKDIEQLTSKEWDVVIDISGYWAGALEQQINVMKGVMGRYIYISTCSHYVFDKENPHPITESEPLVDCTNEQKKSTDPRYYNQNKAECERIIKRELNDNYIILRPGLIIGPHDYTDRLYYWLYKVKYQQNILIGNNGENLLSYTNVNDLVDLIIASIDIKNSYNVYNVPSFVAGLKDFIDHAQKALNKKVNLISGRPEFLKKHGVSEWVDLPLYISGDYVTVDNSRAGLDFDYDFSNIDKTMDELMDFYKYSRKWTVPRTIPKPISKTKESKLVHILKNLN